MLERVIALALLLFGLVWVASLMGTPAAPEPAEDVPCVECARPPPEPPRRAPEEEPPEPRAPAQPPRAKPGLVGGLLGTPR